MIRELQKYSGYHDRKAAWDMDYRTYMVLNLQKEYLE
jgi:hypothetical protein